MLGTRTVQTARGGFRAATLGSGPPLLLLHTLRIQLEYLRGLTLVGESIGATNALVLGARIPDDLPVTLGYGDHGWAAPEHREATGAAIPGVQEPITMEGTGHWCFRDNPDAVVRAVLGAA